MDMLPAIVVMIALWEGARWLVRKAVNSSAIVETLSMSTDIMSGLSRLTQLEGVDRASVLIVEDGGGAVTVGKAKYMSVLYEATTKELGPMIGNFQRITLDGDALEVVLEAIKKGFYVVSADTFSQGSIMRRVMVAYDVKWGVLIPLRDTQSRLFFLWIETLDSTGKILGGKTNIQINAEGGRISRILEAAAAGGIL